MEPSAHGVGLLRSTLQVEARGGPACGASLGPPTPTLISAVSVQMTVLCMQASLNASITIGPKFLLSSLSRLTVGTTLLLDA